MTSRQDDGHDVHMAGARELTMDAGRLVGSQDVFITSMLLNLFVN